MKIFHPSIVTIILGQRHFLVVDHCSGRGNTIKNTLYYHSWLWIFFPYHRCLPSASGYFWTPGHWITDKRACSKEDTIEASVNLRQRLSPEPEVDSEWEVIGSDEVAGWIRGFAGRRTHSFSPRLFSSLSVTFTQYSCQICYENTQHTHVLWTGERLVSLSLLFFEVLLTSPPVAFILASIWTSLAIFLGFNITITASLTLLLP